MSYTGQKNIPGVLQKIVNEIPPFRQFHEPYAGSAAVSAYLAIRSNKFTSFFINDIDEQVTQAFAYPPGSVVTNMPALDYLNQFVGTPQSMGDFIFLDPPYMHQTRPNNIDAYRFEMTAYDHFLMLSIVTKLQCNCMLIHPETELYNRMLSGWRKVKVTIRYHQKTSYEILYCNYAKPGILHTYMFAGVNSWDRQRIKRKGDRILRKMRELPEVERNCLIDRICKEFPPSW